jgi:hypothetical protein
MLMYRQAARQVGKHNCVWSTDLLIYYCGVCTEELRKITKYFNHDSKLLLDTGVI